ncbi:TPA: DUF2971 domain-containing protein, partial [Legionella pneumophila]|nr:DUF2971 domain-containing protein [Legionella pneumophila]
KVILHSGLDQETKLSIEKSINNKTLNAK